MRFRIRKKPASAAAGTDGSTIPASSTAAVLAGIGSAGGGGGAMIAASPDRYYGTENGTLAGHVFCTAAFLFSVTIACSCLFFTFNNMLAIQSVKSIVV
jgi:hypothetical protein